MEVKELSATVSRRTDLPNVKCTVFGSYNQLAAFAVRSHLYNVTEQSTGGGEVDLLLARMGWKTT